MYTSIEPINDLEVLQQRAENACREIGVERVSVERVCTSVGRSAERRVDIHCNYIEHLMWK